MQMHREELSTSVLMIPDGKYLKKTAVLLFAENPEIWIQGAYIKIGYFGSSDSELIYQDEIHGSLIKQIDSAVELLYTKYLKALIDYDGIQRTETYMLPKEACREILLNAVNHKDYSKGVPIQISVYDDKILFGMTASFRKCFRQKIYMRNILQFRIIRKLRMFFSRQV